MKIPVGDFGFSTPERAPRPDIPLGPQPGAAVSELGATGLRIAHDFAKSDELDAHMLYREAHAERERADQEAQRAARAKAGASYTAFENDVYDLNQGLLGQLNRGELTRDDVPGEFAGGVKALKKQHLEDVPEPLQGEIDNHMEQYAFGQRRVMEAGLAHHRQDEALAATMRMRQELQRRSERDLPGAQSTWNTYVDSVVVPEFGEAKGQEAKQIFAGESTVRNLEARMQAAGQSRDVAALGALEQEVSGNDTLDLGQKTRLLEHLAVRTARAQGENASDLEIAVRRGAAGYRQIEDAFHGGIITPAKRTELTVHLDDQRRREQEQLAAEREAIGRVEHAVEGASVLDFRSKPDRDATDLYYSKVLAPSIERSNLEPWQRKAQVANFVSSTGIIPTPIKQEIRGSLRAGNAVAKADAADFLDRLKMSNPQVLNDFSEEDIRVANTINTYVRAGVEPIAAVDLAQKNLAVPAAEREVRKDRYTKLKAEEKNAKWLKDKMIGGSTWRTVGAMLGALPAEVPDALAGEFEQLTREEFVRSGDLDAARTTALDNVRQVWGVTSASSDAKPRLMKYAPETVYHVEGVAPGWVREQLLKEAPKNAFVNEKPDLVLAADALTAREERPSYPIFARRNGVLEPIWGDDGRPARFRPDIATSPYGDRLRKAHAAEKAEGMQILERARARRAAGAQAADLEGEPGGGFVVAP